MASSPLSSSLLPSLSPLHPHPHSSSPHSSLLFSPPGTSLNPFSQRSSHPVVSSSSIDSRKARMSEETQKILEGYGLDPSDFVSQPAHRSRRSKGADKLGKGKRATELPEGPKPPRTTHRLLQVLGGNARRKKLLSPKGMDVRPMMEVVRGAAFDILQVAGGCPASLRPGRWLDLYSGTGSVGIEAISRGCSEVSVFTSGVQPVGKFLSICPLIDSILMGEDLDDDGGAHFVEMDPWVVSEVLRPNLEWTEFLDVSVIHTIRVERFLEHAEHSLGKGGSFDYVSVTPPYTEVDYSILMEQLGKSPLVGVDCFILVEYPLKTSMSDSCGHLIKVAGRRFGRTNLVIYGPTWAEKKRKSGGAFLALE